MSAILIDGRMVAKKWKDYAAQRTQRLIEKGVTPHLAVVLVGENAASQVYVRNKENACIHAGIRSTIIRLPEVCTQEELENAVRDFVDAEEAVKTGTLGDVLSVELLIVKYSTKKGLA